MTRYEKKTRETIRETMENFKKGKLKSGRSGKKVTSRKQAVAIVLSDAREKDAKVPLCPEKRYRFPDEMVHKYNWVG